MIDAWWHSNIRAHAFAIACVGRLWTSFSRIYSEKDFLFSLFFFPKKNQENKKGVPSLPGDGWGGDGRVHASGAKLLCPAGSYYFNYHLIIIISAVLSFYNII